ncbi:MAG: hypothetical protein CAF44_001985 [Nitrospira sp. CG24D]|nr:MAG: hypothetical protein CAF44_001985 [Nitrospira sp. CG24D]
MKRELHTVKKLAAELRMSVKSIQRVYRKGEIPVQWLGRMARFNVVQVRLALKRNGQGRVRHLNDKSARAARDCRQSPASRPENAPDW